MELPKEIEELITLAVSDATELEAEVIEPIHLLIAACRLHPPVVADCLNAWKIDAQKLRQRLQAIAGEAYAKHPDGPQRISQRVMAALDQARRWSQENGHPLGVVTLIISLLESPDELLRKAYRRESLPADDLASDLKRRLSEPTIDAPDAGHSDADQLDIDHSDADQSDEANSATAVTEKRSSERRTLERRAPQTQFEIVRSEQVRLEHPYTPSLDSCSNDYTAAARAGRIDPIIGRRDEIKRVIRILLQKQKSNPVLVGEAGVGKTSIVEGLALQVVAQDAPAEIRNWRIVELSLTALVAGTTYRGELEERLRNIMTEVEADPQLILFIDELHTLIGAGSAIGALDVAGILKPSLARGKMRIIGATTTAEYRRYIEKDAALERRFQPVRVEEPTPAEARQILEGLRSVYESHHAVKITDEALDAAIEYSVEYLTGRRLPDKARDLVDQAAVRKRLIFLTPSNVRKGTPEIGREDIAGIVAEWAGIPVERLFFKATMQPPVRLEEALSRRVIGQDEAIAEVARAVRTSMAGLSQKGRPFGVFLFIGPTGVGKTELAKALAEFLFGNERRLVRFDMSEYMERQAVAKLIGAPPGYVGYDEGGLLIEAVRSHAYSVLLFDEIEKAHPSIWDLFLQIFDDGRLADSLGRTADFRNTIIILTANICSSEDENKKPRYGFRVNSKDQNEQAENKPAAWSSQEELRQLLLKHFRPEFINRIGRVVQFQALGPNEIRSIIDKLIEKVRRRLTDKSLELELAPESYDSLAEAGYKPDWGARELERIIEHQIVEPLAHGLLEGRFKPGETIYVVPALDGVALTNQKD